MTKKKKKPSKRGKKAKDNSLHCPSTAKTPKKGIKKWTKQISEVCALFKALHELWNTLKPIVNFIKK